MRLAATLLARPTLFRITPRIPFTRAMSDVAQFVAAAKKAQPSLAGAEADSKAIEKATGETESLASDLKVGKESLELYADARL